MRLPGRVLSEWNCTSNHHLDSDSRFGTRVSGFSCQRNSKFGIQDSGLGSRDLVVPGSRDLGIRDSGFGNGRDHLGNAVAGVVEGEGVHGASALDLQRVGLSFTVED